MMESHVKEKPRQLNAVVDGLPEELTQLVDQLLSKKADERPATASDTAQTLQAILERVDSPKSDADSAQEVRPLTERLRGQGISQQPNWQLAAAMVAIIAIVIGVAAATQ